MPFTWRWSAVAHGGDNDADPGYFYVPGELVVHAEDVALAEDAKPELDDPARKRSVPSMTAVIYDVTGLEEPPQITEQILALHASARVAPHHALRGDPWYEGGPAAQPEPAPDDYPEPQDRVGDGVVIGVLDTGLSDHPKLRGGQVVDLGPGSDTWDEDGDGYADFESGHGTFVTGVLLREAPGARVLVKRTLNGHGWTKEETLCDHIAELVAAGPLHVLNLSLGGYAHRHAPPVGLTNALAAVPDEVAIVAAAGNYNSDALFYPAAFAVTQPNVISVGAADLERTTPYRAGYSNFGTWVQVCAAGTQIAPFLTYAAERDGSSAAPGGAGAAALGMGVLPQDYTQFEGWAEWKGTSFAAPQVSAALAGIIWAGAAASGRGAIDVLKGAPLPVVPDVGLLVTRGLLSSTLSLY